jgi:hypothetical protein
MELFIPYGKAHNVSLKAPSPFRCHFIIASMFGQQKGLGQGGINDSRRVREPGLEIWYFEEKSEGDFDS